MRAATRLFCFVLLTYVVSKATCLTNVGFYEKVKDYVTDVEIIEPNEESASSDDVGDDVIELPGGPDDKLDIEFLMKKLKEQSNEDSDTAVAEANQRPLKCGGCRCRRHYCKCCVSRTFKLRVWRHTVKFRLNACLKVARRCHGFEITFTINHHRFLHRRYCLRHRNRLSFCYRIPHSPGAKICLKLYNINRRRACAKLTGKVKLGCKRFKVSIYLGCFRLPCMDELDTKCSAVCPEYPTSDDPNSQQEMTYVDDATDDLDSPDDLDLEDALQKVQEMQTDEKDAFDDMEQGSAGLDEVLKHFLEIEEDDQE